MFKTERTRLKDHDQRILAEVIEAAVYEVRVRDVNSVSGLLCSDIADTNYSASIAITELFPPVSRNGPQARLASQVCNMCVATCTDRVVA